MKLKEVEAGKPVTELIVRVVSVAPARMVSTRTGRKTQLREVLVADETGSVILSIWGFGDIEGISAGNIIRIIDGWAKEWQGKIQLSLGRSGRFETVSDDQVLPTLTELGTQHGTTEKE